MIGPIFIYVNSLESFRTPSRHDLDTLAATAGNPTVPPAWKDNATAMWQDGRGGGAKREAGRWPYEWVKGVDYPHKDERAAAWAGRLVLNDPQAATTKLPHLTVGLAHPDGGGRVWDWAHDAKHYQFWADGAEDGTFTIRNLWPRHLHTACVRRRRLGRVCAGDVTVKAGKTLDLSELAMEAGALRQEIWEIGYPTRAGDKFFKGDGENYWLWGWGLRYPLLFPDDATYTVGKSDYRKDWFFEQTPHATFIGLEEPGGEGSGQPAVRLGEGGVPGRLPADEHHRPAGAFTAAACATTWTIKFDMDRAPKGQAALRVALAGADGNGGLAIAVELGRCRHPSADGHQRPRYNTKQGGLAGVEP